MVGVIMDGHHAAIRPGETILDVARRLNIEIPTLCHDDRLAPTGACRLCVVEVKGFDRFVPACHTPATEGMEILSTSRAIDVARVSILRLLAEEYPAEAPSRAPGKTFHRWLKQYGVTARGRVPEPGVFRDAGHPLLKVDMSQCITCFRCVRICDDVQGQFVWKVWDRGKTIRILPKNGGALADSGCVACGACADTCPTGAIEDASVSMQRSPDTWTRTTCPYCGTGCEMMVGTLDSRIVQVKPARDAAVNKGHLCAKGRYAFEFTHARDRVTEPMLRDAGGWKAVSWPEAIDFIATRLRTIIRDCGADSVGILGSARGTNEENYVAQKFARVVLGTNNVDCCARVCHAPTAVAMSRMFGTGAATNSYDDIEHANCLLLCGCNPTEAHPVLGARIKQAARRGARLIVIDPRATELAQCADVHLAVHPGTNVPLLNAMARVIIDEGLVDTAALRERIAGEASFRKFIEPFTPEAAASLCGVRPETIREAARMYAQAAPGMIFHGLGVTEQVQGTDGVMALVNLALLTGNFGKPGSGVNPLRGQNNVQGAAHMGCEPGRLPGFQTIEHGAEAFGAAWGRSVPTAPGLNLMEMLQAARAGKMKALWAIGYDFAFTNPNAAETEEALRNLQLIVVQDLFLNTLSHHAHVFLPAASPFEKDGTFMNAERRVQRVRQVVPPPGNAQPDWKPVCDVAQALGHGAQFTYVNAREIWDELRSLWKAGAGISYARLEQQGLQWPCPDESHPGTRILHIDAFAEKPGANRPRVSARAHNRSFFVPF